MDIDETLLVFRNFLSKVFVFLLGALIVSNALTSVYIVRKNLEERICDLLKSHDSGLQYYFDECRHQRTCFVFKDATSSLVDRYRS